MKIPNIIILLALITGGCSESEPEPAADSVEPPSSPTPATPPRERVEAPSGLVDPPSAVAPVPTPAPPAEEPNPSEPAPDEPAEAVVEAEAPTAPSEESPPNAVDPPGAPTLGEHEGLSLRRLVVAEAIEEREPVGAGQRFDLGTAQVVAFMNLANDTDEPRTILVGFERPDGRTTGQISLTIPPNAGRWRTWARSRNIRVEGRWSAVVSTPNGEEIGRIAFDVTNDEA